MINDEKHYKSILVEIFTPNVVVTAIGVLLGIFSIFFIPSVSHGLAPVMFILSTIVLLVFSILCGINRRWNDVIPLPIVLCFFSVVVGLVHTGSSEIRTQTIRVAPHQVFRTPTKVIVVLNDTEFTSTDIKDYNNKNLMVCKYMSWDSWGNQNRDQWSLCK